MKNVIEYFKGEFDNFWGGLLWVIMFVLVGCVATLIFIACRMTFY